MFRVYVFFGLLAIHMAAAIPNKASSKSHSEIEEVYYKFTGYYDHAKASKYIQKEAGLTCDEEVDQFLNMCRASRTWDVIFDWLYSFEKSTNVKVVTSFLKILTNKNGLKGFEEIGKIAGSADSDGILEILLKLSSKTDLKEMTKFYQDNGKGKGVAGLKAVVTSVTGNKVATFSSVYQQIKGEDNIQESLITLKTSMGAKNTAGAVTALVKLLKTKSFADSIVLLKDVTESTQLKSSIEVLQSVCGKTSLVEIINSIYKSSKTQNMAALKQQFLDAFNFSIIESLRRINNLVGDSDPLGFLSFLLDITLKDNIVDACADVKILSEDQGVNILDLLEEIQRLARNPIKDVLQAVPKVMAEKSLKPAWQKHIIAASGETDLIRYMHRIAKVTDADVLTYASTMPLVFNTPTFTETSALFCNLMETDPKTGYWTALNKLYAITNFDVTECFKLLGSLADNSFEKWFAYLKSSTNKETFVECMEFLGSQSEGTKQALENIKQDPQYYCSKDN